MQRVLSQYSEGDELEIRYYIDPRARHPAECLPAKYPAGFRPTVEKIIARLGGATAARHSRIIDLHLGELRKRIEYRDGERSETFVEKIRKSDWVEPNDFGGLRVALAREIAAAPRKLSKIDRVTVKYRMTFSLDCLGEPCESAAAPWTLDVSAVKVCSLANIQDAKSKILACVDPLDLWSWWDHWEFEREFAGGSGDDVLGILEMDDIYQTYSMLAPYVDHAMLEAVRHASARIAHPRAQQFQRLSPRNTITRLLPKAVEPTLETWITDHYANVTGMILRDKIDGNRELVWIRAGRLSCVSVKSIDDWDEPVAKDEYIFDCEFLNDVWYVLHPLVWKGETVTHLRDSERLELLRELPVIPGLAMCPARIVTDPRLNIKSWWSRRTAYHRDGLILSTDEDYWKQTNVKWKPAEESTIDQLIVRCPDWLQGKAPFVREADGDTLYLLNVGVSSSVVHQKHGFPLKRYLDIFHLDKTARYVPQPFSPRDRPHVYVWSSPIADLDGHIGEFIYEERETGAGWTLRRKRDDKPSLMRCGTEIGNDIKTAMDVWSKIANPFPIEYLWQPPSKQASRFDTLAQPVQRVVSELLEEEAAQSAIAHCCPFIPFDGISSRAALLPDRAAMPSDYRPDLSNNSRVHQIEYSQIGRIELPKEFIGGAQLLVTMDPELLGHVSCLGKCVAAGGRMVVIVRMMEGDDPHPEIGRIALIKEMDRASFTLITDHGVPQDAWEVTQSWDKFSVLSFRKDNRGSSGMKPDDVRKENPHLAANQEANFSYKFSRQKTKDIAGLIGSGEDCASLRVDPLLGELLVDTEFLSTLVQDAQVLYVGTQLERLAPLFPRMRFRTREDSRDTVETIVSHCGYAESVLLIEEYSPNCGLFDFTHSDLDKKIIRGRVMLHPYAALDSTRVSVMYGRDRQTWNISRDIFLAEMMTFHRVYRPTAFKYAQKRAGMDNCYDCRASIMIVTKWAKLQKITLDEAYDRLK